MTFAHRLYFLAALCTACISTDAQAGLDCKKLNDAVAQYGQAAVESFAPSMGYSVAQTRWAIAHCAKQNPKAAGNGPAAVR